MLVMPKYQENVNYYFQIQILLRLPTATLEPTGTTSKNDAFPVQVVVSVASPVINAAVVNQDFTWTTVLLYVYRCAETAKDSL